MESLNPYSPPTEPTSPQNRTAGISLASVVSLFFLAPLMFELVMIPFAPPLGENLQISIELVMGLWLMLLIPGGSFALLGIYFVPKRFSWAVLAAWLGYPVVLCVGVFLHG
jgi:hypothetical protein